MTEIPLVSDTCRAAFASNVILVLIECFAETRDALVQLFEYFVQHPRGIFRKEFWFVVSRFPISAK